MLSKNTTYSAYLVFSLDLSRVGLHSPCKETSVSLGGSRSTRRVCLDVDDGHNHTDIWPSVRGDLPEDTLFSQLRSDGWREVEMGEFCSGEGDDGEVSISLMETSVVKSGLVVLGIEIRPKEQGV